MKKKTVSVRLTEELLERLRRRARLTSGGQHTTLAERYIEEGLRMDEHPRIYFRAGETGRRAAIRGTRLDVATVVDTIVQNDDSITKAAEYLGISVADVQACAAYYADYQAEVDAWRERLREAADIAEAAWHRQQGTFA